MTTPEAPTLVGVAEISARLGVPRTTVSMWDARRASNGFPAALTELAMGPVYDWSQVKAWHEGRKVVTA
jgi:hypothetical protein